MRKIRERYRYSVILLRELVRTDFKLRYQDSILGYIWSLLRPLLLFLILYVVFTKLLKVGNAVPHYPVYLLLGIVLWNYFTEVTGGGVGAIVGRGDLLRKINFPRYTVILSGSMSALINLFLNFIIIAVFMIVGHVGVTIRALWLIPLIVELFFVSIALSFFLSTLYVRFRDLSYVWEVLLQLGFYATPIFYPLSRLPHKYAVLAILNPLAQIIQDARYVLVTRRTQTIGQLYHSGYVWLVPIGITLILTVLSMLYFKKRSRNFAEEI